MQLLVDCQQEIIRLLKDKRGLESSLHSLTQEFERCKSQYNNEMMDLRNISEEKNKTIMLLEERIEKFNADKEEYDRIIRSQKEEIAQLIEDNKRIKGLLRNPTEESIRIPSDIEDIKDENNIPPYEGDEERRPKGSRERAKTVTEEERLEMIEHFLQLGYEMPLILDCEKTYGSDKECIANYIGTGSRN